MSSIEILVQPSNSLHFKNLCDENIYEIVLHGVNQKTYPKLRIKFSEKFENTILIECRLVTATQDNCIHPYLLKSNSKNLLSLSKFDLLTNDTNKALKPNIIYYQVNSDNSEIELDNLTVIKVSDEMIIETLERFFASHPNSKQLALDKFHSFGDLNQARLRLRALLFNEQTRQFVRYISEPVFTQVFYNKSAKKAPEPLQIMHVSRPIARIEGQEPFILLTSDIDRNDIEVEFVEFDDKNQTVWQKFAFFDRTDITNNCVIIIETPKYPHKSEVNKKFTVYQVIFNSLLYH